MRERWLPQRDCPEEGPMKPRSEEWKGDLKWRSQGWWNCEDHGDSDWKELRKSSWSGIRYREGHVGLHQLSDHLIWFGRKEGLGLHPTMLKLLALSSWISTGGGRGGGYMQTSALASMPSLWSLIWVILFSFFVFLFCFFLGCIWWCSVFRNYSWQCSGMMRIDTGQLCTGQTNTLPVVLSLRF